MIIAVLHCLWNASHVHSHHVCVRVTGASQQCTRETCVPARYRAISVHHDYCEINEPVIDITISRNRCDPYNGDHTCSRPSMTDHIAAFHISPCHMLIELYRNDVEPGWGVSMKVPYARLGWPVHGHLCDNDVSSQLIRHHTTRGAYGDTTLTPGGCSFEVNVAVRVRKLNRGKLRPRFLVKIDQNRTRNGNGQTDPTLMLSNYICAQGCGVGVK